MADIVNLRKARKAAKRQAEDRQAAENRARFGQPGHRRDQAERQEALEARRLEGHRRDEASQKPDGEA